MSKRKARFIVPLFLSEDDDLHLLAPLACEFRINRVLFCEMKLVSARNHALLKRG